MRRKFTMKPTIVIAPYHVADFPEGGGHFWVYLQYVLGLRALGCDVYWLERATGDDATFRERMERFGMDGKVILYSAPTNYLTLPRDEAEAVFARADLLLNFHYAIAPALLK